MTKLLTTRNLIWLLFFVATYFMVFLHLDWHPIYVWDEGLFANRAYYWAEYGKYFTNWLELENCDLNHPNTKPPLMSLAQALSFKLFGYSELALRLPIAMLGALSAVLLAWIWRKQSSHYIGIVAGLILLGNSGFNDIHILRSGDHDAAIAFFYSAMLVGAFGLFQGQRLKGKFFYIVALFLACGVLTKSIAAFMWVPGVVLYALLEGRLKELLKNRHFYLSIALFLLLISLFYGIMEMKNPGFLQLVWDNEVNRYGKVLDSHNEAWYWYFSVIADKFSFWLPLVFLGLIGGLSAQDRLIKRATKFTAINAAILLLLLSLASTKLYWYLAPVYPLLALLAGIGVWYLFVKLLGSDLARFGGFYSKIGTICAVLVLAIGVGKTIDSRYAPKDYWSVMRYEKALWRMKNEKPEIKDFTIHTRQEWYPNLIFITNLFNDHYGYNIVIKNSAADLEKDEILLGQEHGRFSNYDMNKLWNYKDVSLLKIRGRKEKARN